MTESRKPLVYHIPVCPFSQRLEILLELKGLHGAAEFRVVDITKPRPAELLAKTRGTTAMPVMETESGGILKESLVLLRYLDDRFPQPRVAQADPERHAIENMLIALAGDFTGAGYRFVMNRDPAKRGSFVEAMNAQYAALDDFLRWHAPERDFLFEAFGLAEAVFTPMFARFWFLGYYEDYEIPEKLARVRRWCEACLAHPAAQQVTRERIVKLYYDYALGVGNGALPEGRRVSSFTFESDWPQRPWPPRDKWGAAATDAELGLI